MSIMAALEAHPGGISAVGIGAITGYPAGQVLNDLNDITCYTDMSYYFAIYDDRESPDVMDESPGSPDAGDDRHYRVKSTDVKWKLSVTSRPYPPVTLDFKEAMALYWLFEEFPPPDPLLPLYRDLLRRLAPPELAAARDLARHIHSRGGVNITHNSHLEKLRDAVLGEKVLKEFSARGMPKPARLPDGSPEYHGEVLGIRDFKRWVLSFGSSAEVIEPGWLREEMIETARNWIETYG